MKIGTLLIGVLLIIGAVSEYSLTPIILDKVDNITNNLETSMVPTMSTNPQNQAYASMMTDATTKASQLTSSMTMLETKVSDYTTWASGLMGVGFVAYGVLAKNNTRMKSSNSEALDVLKMRLAKGEITKNQFNHLKNDVA
jgi:hypothetical protein